MMRKRHYYSHSHFVVAPDVMQVNNNPTTTWQHATLNGVVPAQNLANCLGSVAGKSRKQKTFLKSSILRADFRSSPPYFYGVRG